MCLDHSRPWGREPTEFEAASGGKVQGPKQACGSVSRIRAARNMQHYFHIHQEIKHNRINSKDR
jgi:hypothetical protein